MRKSLENRIIRFVGHAQSVGSLALSQSKELSRLWGTVQSVSGEAVRWKYVPLESAAPAPENWFVFEGTVKASLLPSGYTEVAIFTFPKAEVSALVAETGGRQSAAYAIGKVAVLGGTVRQGELFGTDPVNPALHAVAMGINGGELRATPGIWLSDGSFQGLPDAIVETRRANAADVVAPIVRI